MKKPRSAVQVGIYIRTETESNYFHVRGSIVTIGPTLSDLRALEAGELSSTVGYTRAWTDKIRNVDELNGLDFNGLEINSQGNNDDRERHLYGWDLRYRDRTYIERFEAKRMYQTLTTLETKLDKLTEQFGSPATFGAYLARIATAISAKSFVLKPIKDAGRSQSFDDTNWRILPVREGVYSVDRLIDAWVNTALATTASKTSFSAGSDSE